VELPVEALEARMETMDLKKQLVTQHQNNELAKRRIEHFEEENAHQAKELADSKKRRGSLLPTVELEHALENCDLKKQLREA